MTEPPIPFETIPLDVFVHHFDIFYFVFLLRAERSSLKLLLLRTPIFSLTVRFRFLIFIPTINRALHCFCRSHSLVHPVRFHPNAFWLVWEHWLVGGIGWIPAALLLLEIQIHYHRNDIDTLCHHFMWINSGYLEMIILIPKVDA